MNFFNTLGKSIANKKIIKKKEKNSHHFQAFIIKVIVDIIYIALFGMVTYGIFILLSKIDFKFYTNSYVLIPFDESKKDAFNLLMAGYSFRLFYLIFLECYYWTSKLERSTLCRGSRTEFSDKNNVQFFTVMLVHPIYMVIKLFLEYLFLNLLVLIFPKDFLMTFLCFDPFNAFNNSIYSAGFNMFFIFNLLLSTIFSVPLSVATLLSTPRKKDGTYLEDPANKGNYIFKFMGDPFYVGNADNGLSNRLTKYNNGAGADDTLKIHLRRFYLRVTFLKTGESCKTFEDFFYIFHGCPLINTKDTWGHIR